MPRSENQKQKLFRILELFVRLTDEENGLPLSEIKRLLWEEYGIEAERKSLYDDFATLTSLGYPIEKCGTRPETYTLASRAFEIAELKMLVDAVGSSKFITVKKSRELIEKLMAFAGKRHAGELSREVYVDDRVKTENVATVYTVDAIHRALGEKKQFSFRYFHYDQNKNKVFRHGGARYTVSPKALVWNDENYYLCAFDEGEGIMKNFRVDKMDRPDVEETYVSEASRAVAFNSAAYAKKTFAMFGEEEVLVTFEARERLADVVFDRFGRELTLIFCPFGFRFTTGVMVSPTFFSWVASFAGDMRIVTPAPVCEKFVAMLEKNLANYAKSEGNDEK